MKFNDKSQKYCEPFLHSPSSRWISNVETTLSTEKIDEFIFPVSLNEKEYSSSYVCSPYDALVNYSKDELFKIKSRLLRLFLSVLIKLLGIILRVGKIDKNRCINNFLFSTNPYPAWHGKGAELQLQKSLESHPHHAMI